MIELISSLIFYGCIIYGIYYCQKEINTNDRLIAEHRQRIAELRESINHAKFAIWEYDFKQDLKEK